SGLSARAAFRGSGTGQGPCHADFRAKVKEEGALPHDDLAGRRRTAARTIDFARSYSSKLGLRGQSVFAAYFRRSSAMWARLIATRTLSYFMVTPLPDRTAFPPSGSSTTPVLRATATRRRSFPASGECSRYADEPRQSALGCTENPW